MMRLLLTPSQSLRMSPVVYGGNQKIGFKGLHLSTYRTYTYCKYVRGIRPALKQYPYGHKFTHDRKLEKVVTPFLITQDKGKSVPLQARGAQRVPRS